MKLKLGDDMIKVVPRILLLRWCCWK